MHPTPLVSIIIPTYNRAHLIEETLDSIIAQTYKNWECIVVDDGSTDNTSEVMAEYTKRDSRIQYHHRPEEHLPGGNGARNYGFKLSKGEYIQWFDDDDLMLPNKIKAAVIKMNTKISLTIDQLLYWDAETDIKIPKPIIINTNLYKDYLCNGLEIYTPSVLFKRVFLNDKKLFDENLQRGQETEFLLRIFQDLNINRYVIINEYSSLYRRHELSKTFRNKKYISSYKSSLYEIYYRNFLWNLKNKDPEIIQYCFNKIISLFYSSLNNKDRNLSSKIINDFLPKLIQINFRKGFEIYITGNFFYYTQKNSWKVYQRWKQFKIA